MLIPNFPIFTSFSHHLNFVLIDAESKDRPYIIAPVVKLILIVELLPLDSARMARHFRCHFNFACCCAIFRKSFLISFFTTFSWWQYFFASHFELKFEGCREIFLKRHEIFFETDTIQNLGHEELHYKIIKSEYSIFAYLPPSDLGFLIGSTGLSPFPLFVSKRFLANGKGNPL